MTTNITAIDMVSIKQQCNQKLSQYDTWKDLLPTGTGTALTDFIASIGVNDLYAIEHGFRENFSSARLDSSIYSQMTAFGGRLSRKTPCSITVEFTTLNNVTIPAYSQFLHNSCKLFNKEAFTVVAGEATTIVLYEGQVKTQTLTGTGTSYQLYVSSEDKFIVSETDVIVTINNKVIPVTTKGLWTRYGLAGCQDITSDTGQLVLVFGGAGYGTIPNISDNVSITYVTNNGAGAQNASIINTRVYSNEYGVIGKTLTGLTGGLNQIPASTYKKIGPQIFGGRKYANIQEQYAALAISYPGVYDAKVLGQRDLAPTDKRWSNLVQVSLLTDRTWTGPEWDKFEAYMEENGNFLVQCYRKDPEPVYVDLDATIYCKQYADKASVLATATKSVEALFTFKPGLIDANVYIDDYMMALKQGQADLVEYVVLNTPTSDTILQVTAVENVILEQIPGSLPPNQYTYSITAVTEAGETITTNFISILLSTTGGVRLSWDEVPGAKSYNIYGRDLINTGLVKNVITTTYDDLSNTAVTTGINVVNTITPRYPVLRNCNIKVNYTKRSLYSFGV